MTAEHSREDRHVQVARGFLGQSGERVPGRTRQADHETAVLQVTIGVEEASPDCTDVGALRLRVQRGQPARAVGFDVVVQEQEDVTPGDARGGVVETGPVERPSVPQDPYVGAALQLIDQRHRLGIGRPVVDQHQLDLLTPGRRCDGVHAGAQEPGLVAERDQDADADPAVTRSPQAERARRRTDRDRRLLVPAGQCRLHVAHICGGRPLVSRPVAEHLGDMGHRRRRLACGEGARVLQLGGTRRVEVGQRAREAGADREGTSDVRRREEELGRVAGLEARRIVAAVGRQPVLVRVDDPRRCEGLAQEGHRVGCPDIARGRPAPCCRPGGRRGPPGGARPPSPRRRQRPSGRAGGTGGASTPAGPC